MFEERTRELLVKAPHYQGGHSMEGAAIALELGIPFPLSMKNLRPRAVNGGYEPYDLWPWLKAMDGQKVPRRRIAASAQRRGELG